MRETVTHRLPLVQDPAVSAKMEDAKNMDPIFRGIEVRIFRVDNEVRTRDLDLGKVALYQLSYVHVKNHCTEVRVFRGRYWDRTSDLFRVREARYRCANRPCFCMFYYEVGTGFEPA